MAEESDSTYSGDDLSSSSEDNAKEQPPKKKVKLSISASSSGKHGESKVTARPKLTLAASSGDHCKASVQVSVSGSVKAPNKKKKDLYPIKFSFCLKQETKV